jgi:hypothetical protein
MKAYVIHEPDQWNTNGAQITSPENLEIIRETLEDDGPIIVEHWLYRRSSAPDRFIFDSLRDFMEHLETKARAGDLIEVWNFPKVCTDENRLVFGKCPDDQGRVPKKGAY